MARARLVLTALFLFWGGVAVFGDPPRALRCPLLDERGTPTPRGALLRILGGPETPPSPETPRDPLEKNFDVRDPWGVLEGFWGPSGEPPRCELSPTAPLPPPPGSGTAPKCPQGTRWWLLALGTSGREGTALLQEGEGDTDRVTASLFISTLSPTVRGLVGSPQSLHCALTPDPGPFTLEWLHHRDGATRRLLAFDSATARVTGAAPGVLLLLGGRDPSSNSGGDVGTQPPGGALELSVQLPPLSVSDGGSFVCSVSTARGQVQQVLRMSVMAPPQVSLLPAQLPAGLPAELRCDAVGFFPLDVGIRWERRARGEPRPLEPSPGLAWSSGHRRAANGTFSRSAGLRVALGTPGDSYSCLVTHPAWDRPHRVTVHVAGDSGPSVEDMAGMALVAFVIGGLCLRLWPPEGR
ncbi:tapasin [Catharus ustulatus]|uniref:tapasin n=1 Tax=Catharus ustulatus TaxID=91951 RepID=UPI00140ACA32|nr:tapasin [Catharus ustulatus]